MGYNESAGVGQTISQPKQTSGRCCFPLGGLKEEKFIEKTLE